MIEKDDFGNEGEKSKLINVHKIGEREYELDPTVLNDPDKINIDQVAEVLGCSKSHARFLSGEDQENWPKKNAMIDGRMYAYYSKKLILEYKAKRDKKSRERVSEAETSPNPQEPINKEGEQKQGSQENAIGPQIPFNKLNSPMLFELDEKAHLTLSNVETVLKRNEKEKYFLRILIPVLFIIFSLLIVYIVENFKSTTKTILNLNDEVMKQKEETINAEYSAKEKDNEIKFLKDQIGHPVLTQQAGAGVQK